MTHLSPHSPRARADALGLFRNLGDDVLRRWRTCDFNAEQFPAAAAAALAEAGCHRRVDWRDVVRTFLGEDSPPLQLDSRHRQFGQPQLTVYRHSRFHVEVLFWVDGTTTIHQHGFVGAFQVLAGSSIHTRYRFALQRRVHQALGIGDAQVEEVELLEPGAVRGIEGPKLTHALFHLERPSVTIVVRAPCASRGPQYSYLPPHVEWDPDFEDRTQDKKILLLELLRNVERPAEYAAAVADFAASEDLHTAFRALLMGFEFLRDCDRLVPVLERAREAHGEAMDRIAVSLERWLWCENIARRRADVHDADHRLFLALLLNVPSRFEIVRLVEARFRRPPIDVIMDWMRALARIDRDGAIDLLGVLVTASDTPHAEEIGTRLADVFFWYVRARLEQRSREGLAEELKGQFSSLSRTRAEELLASWSPLDTSLFMPLFR